MSDSTKPPEKTEAQKSNSKLRGVLRFFARLFLVLIIAFLLLFGLLQVPFIQNYTADRITDFLSAELDTEVHLNYVYLEFFDRLVLEDFYVQDHKGDTLLYAKKLKANLDTGPWSWINNTLGFENITLIGARLNIRKAEGETENNLQVFLHKFKRNPDKPSNPLFFNVEEIHLSDVQVINDDKVRGEQQTYAIDKGYLKIKELNLLTQRYDIVSVWLDKPVFRVDKYAVGVPPQTTSGIATADDNSVPDTTTLRLTVQDFQINKGRFVMNNWRLASEKTTPDNIFDPQFLSFDNIDMVHTDAVFTQGELTSRLKHLSLDESSGFKLIALTAKDFSISNRKLALEGMRLETPYSSVGDTFIMKYRAFNSFGEFNDKVLMQAQFNNAIVALRDIMTFAPTLQRNIFFINNRDEVVSIDGTVSGKVNNLRGRDLSIKLAHRGEFKGDFSSRNLAVRNEELLNLQVDRLQTNIRTFKELVPEFNPPESFYSLGRINFKGSFDGFFEDFVAFGDLRSEVGRAVMDMRLNVKNGREKAEYSGKLDLIDFNLAKWSDNPAFGSVTMSSKVVDGRGLTANSAKANLSAQVENLTFRDYNYKNIIFTGELDKNHFDGNLEINDDNIDLVFSGEVDYKDSIPVLNFKSDVRTLDLFDLNLAKQHLVLSGHVDMNLRDIKLSDMQGRIAVEDFKLVKNASETFVADSIVIQSRFDDLVMKKFTVDSDLMEAELKGIFDIEEVPQVFIAYFTRNFPEFSEKFGIKKAKKPLQPVRFDYSMRIFDMQNFTHLISPKLDSLQDVRFSGHFNTFGDNLDMDLVVPKVKFDNWMFSDVALQSELNGSEGNLDIAISKSVLNGKTEFSPVTVLGLLQRDTYQFAISSFSPILNTVDNLNLNGKFFLHDDNYEINFLPSNLLIWQQKWVISPENYIRFGNNEIQTKNFKFLNGNRAIIFESVGSKGLKATFKNFDLDFIGELWDYDKLNFSGKFRFDAVAQDIYALKNITASGAMDSLMINGDYFGNASLNLDLAGLRSPLNATFSVRDGAQQLRAEGFYLLPAAARARQEIKQKPARPNYFDFDLKLGNFPLRTLEYFIGEGISRTEGEVDATCTFFGVPQQPEVKGVAQVEAAKVTINYLQTTYTIDKADLTINNYLIDATNGVLTDKFGNTATVFGGITHNHLRDFGLDVQVLSDQFLVLDTDKDDNEVYYGQAIAQGDIRFTGSFSKTDIFIDGETRKGTKLIIPVSSGQDASEVSFIRFKDKSQIKLKEATTGGTLTELRGVNLVMQFTATEDAEMLLIFDERAGDIIRGRGRGDIQIKVTREGEFNMFGSYEIASGEYLFTLLNLVNKPFSVQQGGTIRWFGDPFGAEVNIVAEYKGLNTPVSPLIQEYLTLLPQDVRNEAAKPTEVDLTMLLKGELLKPTISFDIEFPVLSGDLKTYAQSKLRIIKQDQNELNRQVFGLIVAGQFLPSTYQFSGGEVAINTVTELLANQFSLYLTDLLSEVVTDVKFISGVDFDIAYNFYEGTDILQGEERFAASGSELQVRLKNYLFNDRLSINTGVNFNLDDNSRLVAPTVNAGAFTAGDIIVEYALTNDRRLKLRAYASQEVVIGGGTKRKYGAGISFRHEFDTFREFLSGFKKTVQKLEKERR